MLLILAAMLMNRSRHSAPEDLPLNREVDLDPLSTFAAAMQLGVMGGRTWGDGQVFLNEDALRLELDLGTPELHICRRESPELTGHGLDLLLHVRGAHPEQRRRLEDREAQVLELVHAHGAEVCQGVLRWQQPLGDVHSFNPVLPSVPEMPARLEALKSLATALMSTR